MIHRKCLQQILKRSLSSHSFLHQVKSSDAHLYHDKTKSPSKLDYVRTVFDAPPIFKQDELEKEVALTELVLKIKEELHIFKNNPLDFKIYLYGTGRLVHSTAIYQLKLALQLATIYNAFPIKTYDHTCQRPVGGCGAYRILFLEK